MMKCPGAGYARSAFRRSRARWRRAPRPQPRERRARPRAAMSPCRRSTSDTHARAIGDREHRDRAATSDTPVERSAPSPNHRSSIDISAINGAAPSVDQQGAEQPSRRPARGRRRFRSGRRQIMAGSKPHSRTEHAGIDVLPVVVRRRELQRPVQRRLQRRKLAGSWMRAAAAHHARAMIASPRIACRIVHSARIAKPPPGSRDSVARHHAMARRSTRSSPE